MARINENYLRLQSSYLFVEIGRRVAEYQTANPSANIIRLGIGDVTRPLVPAIIKGLHKSVEEMAEPETFKGYGPDGGYDFLRELIAKNDYASGGASIQPDEIFVSDGAKSDTANIQEIFGINNVVAVTDPVYPVYVDSNIMAGRTDIEYLPCTAENGFVPEFPKRRVDIIYLCYPNNPTGAVATKAQLKAWVDYARENNAIILYDAAYEAYIKDPDIPKTIYEIDGAAEVAIEFRSFSKTAGFTGTRCGFTVVPKAVTAETSDGKRAPLHPLWSRRQSTKFNQTAYIIQAAAAAVYTDEGQAQIKDVINYYMDNARVIKEGLSTLGITNYGGDNSPYVWMKTPNKMKSWDFFDKLLTEANVVGTPGAGFGSAGEGYFRLTAFGDKEKTREAIDRFAKLSL